MERAGMAASFIAHPYWRFMSKFLSNVVSAETESLLDKTRSQEHDMNRAAVSVARRLLQMPFIDIEQGKQAIELTERMQSNLGTFGRAQSGALR